MAEKSYEYYFRVVKTIFTSKRIIIWTKVKRNSMTTNYVWQPYETYILLLTSTSQIWKIRVS